jgi:hypothetical protein
LENSSALDEDLFVGITIGMLLDFF